MRTRPSLPVIAWLAAVVLLAGCGGGGGGGTRSGDDVWTNTSPPIYTVEDARKHAKWTVLVYLDADNDLESAGIHNFNQMEVVGSTQDVHVIVQMDRKSGSDPQNEQWTDTRRYLITRDADTGVMHSVRLDNPPLGELDMGSGATLRSFVVWGKANFPADHYLLVVWDHGSGWQARFNVSAQYKYVAADDTSGSAIDIKEIPSALADCDVDVIAFDACYMQQLEVAYELRNCARYIAASTAAEPSPGYNYSRVLGHISGSTDPEQLSLMIVRQYAAEYPNDSRVTHSAVDLSHVAALADAAGGFAQVLRAHADDRAAELADARRRSLDFATVGTRRYSLDLMDYASRCANAVGPDADDAHARLQTAFDAAVIASVHSSDLPNAHGLAIYAPPPSQYDNSYALIRFAKDTEWDEWLQAQRQ